MSYMSELSIAAATTRHEGPTILDDLAHRIAHAAVHYHLGDGSTETYTVLREMCQEFQAISKIQDMCRERRITPRQLFNEVAHELARQWATGKGTLADRMSIQDTYAMISSVIDMI